jgi:hypothetical protein
MDVAPRMRGATLLLFFSLLTLIASARAQQAAPAACATPPGSLLLNACDRLRDQPERYASAPARARPGPERLTHGVARLEGGRIDVESVLADLRPVGYRLRFQAIGPPRGATNESFSIVIDGNALEWKTDWPVERGLFRVTLHPQLPNGAPPINDEVWVLVEEGRYDAISAAFKRISDSLASVGDAIAAADRALLLRAVLDDFAYPR